MAATWSLNPLEQARLAAALSRGWLSSSQLETLTAKNGLPLERILDFLEKAGALSSKQVRILKTQTVTMFPMGSAAPSRSVTATPIPLEQDDVLRVGDTLLGRYRILRNLAGGFGNVYVCNDLATESLCAFKTLRRKHLDSQAKVKIIESEVLRWIGVGSHPNIVQVHGLEYIMALPFIHMEYVDGGRTLQEVVGHCDVPSALSFAHQIALAMKHASNACGLIHRDLKPLNILINPQGVAKVTDFGLAIAVGQTCSTEGWKYVGTPAYMAPEQWARPNDVDSRADIYSFGIILHELLTGQLPFDFGSTLEEYRRAHEESRPADIREFSHLISSDVARFTLCCLEKNPDDRPKDFASVALALRQMVGNSVKPLDAPLRSTTKGLVNQALTYHKLGRGEEALEFAMKALNSDPDDLEAQLALATSLVGVGMFTDAQELYLEVLSEHPDLTAALSGAAMASHAAGNQERALMWAREALRTARDSSRAFFHLEHALGILGDKATYGWEGLDEALEICNRILEQDPRFVLALNMRGVLNKGLGRYQEALKDVVLATELNPLYAPAWSNCANLFALLWRLDEGLEAANEALRLNSRLLGPYLAKANILWELDHKREACEVLRDGLRIHPGHTALRARLEGFERVMNPEKAP